MESGLCLLMASVGAVLHSGLCLPTVSPDKGDVRVYSGADNGDVQMGSSIDKGDARVGSATDKDGVWTQLHADNNTANQVQWGSRLTTTCGTWDWHWASRCVTPTA
ncbi:hypothetical protein B0H14DRAFT_2630616 [Mycena olivaceomarginata]|nr:hypothetical protein B0H14DRAFT_2630616 [Mycena olivaceomarginata]